MTYGASLSGQVALVTGASGGIGAAITRTLAAQGVAVAVHYYRQEEKARLLVEEVRSSGGQAIAAQADCSEPSDVQRLTQTVVDKLGPIAILINNAAPSYTFDPTRRDAFESVDWKDYQAQYDGIVKATFLTCQAVLPGMRERRFGRIVSILTNLVFNPEVVYHAYTTAKSSLLGFSRTLAADVGPSGITVNLIAPGLIAETGLSAHHTEMTLNDVAKRTPLGRVGRPQDIADAALYLVSTSFVTGTCLVVDGGLTMR